MFRHYSLCHYHYDVHAHTRCLDVAIASDKTRANAFLIKGPFLSLKPPNEDGAGSRPVFVNVCLVLCKITRRNLATDPALLRGEQEEGE